MFLRLCWFPASDLAAAIHLSINENQQQIVVNIPSGNIPPPVVRIDGSRAPDARVAPAADVPSIKSIHELKDRLSIGSLFKMKRDWLARLVIWSYFLINA